MFIYSVLVLLFSKYLFSIFCTPKKIFSELFILKIFFEKLNIKKTKKNIRNFFLENSFEIKILEKIKNTKVIKICIANRKTGEKFSQKNKLMIIKLTKINFFLSTKSDSDFFFKTKIKINNGKIIAVKCSIISK